MAKANTLPVSVREGVGKGAARAARREGYVPAVVYGGGQDPVPLNIRQNELLKALKRGKFLTSLLDLDLGESKIRVVPREVQRDVVLDLPTHVDFLRLSDSTRINLFIAVEFINHADSPGLKRGGVLNVVRHEVELKVRAGDIPEKITVDLAGAKVGDSLHISAVELPKDVTPVISDRDFTIATIAAPSGLAAGDDEEEAAEEG